MRKPQVFLGFSLISALIWVNTGCSSLDKISAANAEHRQFQIRKLWVRQTTEKQNMAFRKINRMAPVFYRNKKAGETVIQANALDGILAYGRESGRVIWRRPIPNGVEASIALVNETLFVGANDGQFYSLNAETGEVNWTFPTRIENLSEPLVSEGVVYFLSGNNSLYALDASTGKQLWLYTRQDPSSLSIRGGSKPLIRNGTLYVGFSDGSFVALLASTGTVKWEVLLNKNKKFRDMDSDPVLDGDLIYIMGFDQATYCLKASTGEIVWKNDHGGYGRALVHGDFLYLPTTSDEVVSLEKSTGKKVWSYTIAAGIATSPAYFNGTIVFGESQGALIFLDARSGRLIKRFEPGKGVFSPATVDEKKSQVFFISNEANLYGLEAKWAAPPAFSFLR